MIVSVSKSRMHLPTYTFTAPAGPVDAGTMLQPGFTVVVEDRGDMLSVGMSPANWNGDPALTFTVVKDVASGIDTIAALVYTAAVLDQLVDQVPDTRDMKPGEVRTHVVDKFFTAYDSLVVP